MSRGRGVRAYKVCKICGEGYDAFKAFDARGRFCSPACLTESRRRNREAVTTADLAMPAVGPAMLPATVSLGSLSSMVRLDPGFETGERRLV